MKETNLLKTLPPMKGPSWLVTGCWLAGWQADCCMCVRVGTAGDKPCSSLLPIRVPGLKNNSPIVAHKSKPLNAVSNSIPVFDCGAVAITLA